MLLERLGDLFTKNLCHNGEVFFIRYMNNIESNIDESDLICIKAKSYCFLEATSHADKNGRTKSYCQNYNILLVRLGKTDRSPKCICIRATSPTN
jgi:hypothetical protein